MTEPTRRRGAAAAARSVRPSDAVSGPEYAALVVLLAVGIIGAALFVAWAAEQRGILAPGTVPIPHHEAEADGPGPDPAE